ncbi:tetratricopeptide repeat protein [Microcoleus sp. LEGE 07076]|uniref:tetratricopeptide repeat protein n=1 Tax=Microcoleus sp. LEGE 07076 TaxID=915322 RepID=UPI001881E31C|nr:tetratricopeptide repeat protein [Microcoleus sp. LEGE 07076]MBE9188047.1 tetratricopeptide repeat protein [Microcoleus sp. LEGE 07076]
MKQPLVFNLDDYKCYHNLASSLVKEDKLDEATLVYLGAIELYPKCSWLHHYLGNVLQKQGKLAESVSAYQQAIELYPNFSWSHNNLGNALEKQGKLEESIAAYRRAIELYPNFYLFHTNLDKAVQKLSHLSILPPKSYSKLISPFASLDNLRLAIVSTPRSGNTWLRKLLASMYDLPQIAVHTPREIAWQSLPPKVILQIHWRDTDNFVSLLAENGFRPIVIARHPLDVLISILHFATYESQTARWLDGEAGSEISIINKFPLCSEFIDYAVGKRSAALLSISASWWNRENSRQIRYENLVADTAEELSKLNEQLGMKPVRPILDVIPLNSIASLRTTAANNHFWQGNCGHWKQLLTAEVARRIAISHQRVLNQLGYVCDADENLTEEMAVTAWNSIAVSAVNS